MYFCVQKRLQEPQRVDFCTQNAQVDPYATLSSYYRPIGLGDNKPGLRRSGSHPKAELVQGS